MNRRAFLTALAAVTGAVAFPWLPEHEQPVALWGIDHSTNVWWRREGKSHIGGLSDPEFTKEMERLWIECMNYSGRRPNYIVLDQHSYDLAKKLQPEWFA